MKSLTDELFRQQRRKEKVPVKILSQSFRKRNDQSFHKLLLCIDSLKDALRQVRWSEVSNAVNLTLSYLLDSQSNDNPYQTKPEKKHEYELFIELGGVDLLLRLFKKPFSEPDARSMTNIRNIKRGETWNEILAILRELCYAIPTLSNNIFSREHIVFLFTMLSHPTIFDSAINMLEEILSTRVETFSLSLIPNLYSLIDKFTTRQLAHFCRVLSLVLFEPEDRQIIEGSHILRSYELLQLRRDRMAKSGYIVERNQSLIIEMPGLIDKFVQLLRILNYGPSLSDLMKYNIVTHVPSYTIDIFETFIRPIGTHSSTTTAVTTTASSSSSSNATTVFDEFQYLHKLDMMVIEAEKKKKVKLLSATNTTTMYTCTSISSNSSGSSTSNSSNHTSFPVTRNQSPYTHYTINNNNTTQSTTAMNTNTNTNQAALSSSSFSSSLSRPSQQATNLQDAVLALAPFVTMRDQSQTSVHMSGLDLSFLNEDSPSREQTTPQIPQVTYNTLTQLLQGVTQPLTASTTNSSASNSNRGTTGNNTRSNRNDRTTADDGNNDMDSDENDNVMEELLRAFSPNVNETSTTNPNDLRDHFVMYYLAHRLGISNMSNLSASDGSLKVTLRAAKNKLRVTAMLLAPHQVELLFVLCTLLSSRRKLEVQKIMAKLNLGKILLTTYSRMSWEAPPYKGINPLEHIHGPGCECNPESALRVQFLRLVHNYYDLDFMGNSNKWSLLSHKERQLLLESSRNWQDGMYIPDTDKGILSKIAITLQSETSDSIYRFWLSSCIEAFLRGNIHESQVFIARLGILAHIIQEIRYQKCINLQISFDLLGELIKNNGVTLRMLESTIGDNEEVFSEFMEIVLKNLVDSNVFIRSLYLSIHTLSYSEIKDIGSDKSSNHIEVQDNRNTKDKYTDVNDTFTHMKISPSSSKYYSEGRHIISDDIAENTTDCDVLLTEQKPLSSLKKSPMKLTSDVLKSANYLTHTWIQFEPEVLIDSHKLNFRSSSGTKLPRLSTTRKSSTSPSIRTSSKLPHLINALSSSSRLSRSPIVTEGRTILSSSTTAPAASSSSSSSPSTSNMNASYPNTINRIPMSSSSSNRMNTQSIIIGNSHLYDRYAHNSTAISHTSTSHTHTYTTDSSDINTSAIHDNDTIRSSQSQIRTNIHLEIPEMSKIEKDMFNTTPTLSPTSLLQSSHKSKYEKDKNRTNHDDISTSNQIDYVTIDTVLTNHDMKVNVAHSDESKTRQVDSDKSKTVTDDSNKTVTDSIHTDASIDPLSITSTMDSSLHDILLNTTTEDEYEQNKHLYHSHRLEESSHYGFTTPPVTRYSTSTTDGSSIRTYALNRKSIDIETRAVAPTDLPLPSNSNVHVHPSDNTSVLLPIAATSVSTSVSNTATTHDSNHVTNTQNAVFNTIDAPAPTLSHSADSNAHLPNTGYASASVAEKLSDSVTQAFEGFFNVANAATSLLIRKATHGPHAPTDQSYNKDSIITHTHDNTNTNTNTNTKDISSIHMTQSVRDETTIVPVVTSPNTTQSNITTDGIGDNKLNNEKSNINTMSLTSSPTITSSNHQTMKSSPSNSGGGGGVLLSRTNPSSSLYNSTTITNTTATSYTAAIDDNDDSAFVTPPEFPHYAKHTNTSQYMTPSSNTSVKKAPSSNSATIAHSWSYFNKNISNSNNSNSTNSNTNTTINSSPTHMKTTVGSSSNGNSSNLFSTSPSKSTNTLGSMNMISTVNATYMNDTSVPSSSSIYTKDPSFRPIYPSDFSPRPIVINSDSTETDLEQDQINHVSQFSIEMDESSAFGKSYDVEDMEEESVYQDITTGSPHQESSKRKSNKSIATTTTTSTSNERIQGDRNMMESDDYIHETSQSARIDEWGNRAANTSTSSSTTASSSTTGRTDSILLQLSPYSFIVPDYLQRLHTYLTNKREIIVLRLITTVKIRTINHENICCVNTALLILLLAQRRGELVTLLRDIKLVAGHYDTDQSNISPIARRKNTTSSARMMTSITNLSSRYTNASASTSDINMYMNTSYSFSSSSSSSSTSSPSIQPVTSENKEQQEHQQQYEADGPVGEYDTDDVDTYSGCNKVNHDNNNSSSDYSSSNIKTSRNNELYATSSQSTVHSSMAMSQSPSRRQHRYTSYPADSTSTCTCMTHDSSLQTSSSSSPTTMSHMTYCPIINNTNNNSYTNNNQSVPTPNKLKTESNITLENTVNFDITNTININNPQKVMAYSTYIKKEKSNSILFPNTTQSYRSYLAMKNFRALLWYWREYYIRRGRDRLSIEFSSHIPFPYWSDLVDLLCRDDGSPTSLLRNRWKSPRSPYQYPPRFNNSATTDIVYFTPITNKTPTYTT